VGLVGGGGGGGGGGKYIRSCAIFYYTTMKHFKHILCTKANQYVTAMGMHVIVGLLHYNFLCYVTCKFGVANVAWLVTSNLYMFKSSGIIYCVIISIPVYTDSFSGY